MNVDQFAEENGVVFEDDYLDEEPDEVIICEIVKPTNKKSSPKIELDEKIL